MIITDKASGFWATAWAQFCAIRRILPLVLVVLSIAVVFVVGIFAIQLHLGIHIEATFYSQILGFSIAGLVLSVTIAWQAQSAREATRREIYQRLELEAIALFRFDIANTKLAAYIWSDVRLPNKDKFTDDLKIRLLQYICQYLNLFEMAVRFRADGVMPPDIFGSWVIWIDSFCRSKNFCAYWHRLEPELRWNYISQLRDIIDHGLLIHHDGISPIKQPEEKTKKFFSFIADEYNCDVVKKWLDGTSSS